MNDLKKYLEEVKLRLSKATPGPWINDGGQVAKEIKGKCYRLVTLDGGYFKGAAPQENDGEFIANAPADIACLIEIIEKLIESDKIKTKSEPRE